MQCLSQHCLPGSPGPRLGCRRPCNSPDLCVLRARGGWVRQFLVLTEILYLNRVVATEGHTCGHLQILRARRDTKVQLLHSPSPAETVNCSQGLGRARMEIMPPYLPTIPLLRQSLVLQGCPAHTLLTGPPVVPESWWEAAVCTSPSPLPPAFALCCGPGAPSHQAQKLVWGLTVQGPGHLSPGHWQSACRGLAASGRFPRTPSS